MRITHKQLVVLGALCHGHSEDVEIDVGHDGRLLVTMPWQPATVGIDQTGKIIETANRPRSHHPRPLPLRTPY